MLMRVVYVSVFSFDTKVTLYSVLRRLNQQGSSLQGFFFLTAEKLNGFTLYSSENRGVKKGLEVHTEFDKT